MGLSHGTGGKTPQRYPADHRRADRRVRPQELGLAGHLRPGLLRVYLPGCPPRPETLLDAIAKLHDKIQNMKLGANREKEIIELEQALLRKLPLIAGMGGRGRHSAAGGGLAASAVLEETAGPQRSEHS